MLNGILNAVIRKRLLVLLAGAAVLVAGAVAWVDLPIDAFPDVTNVQVMILTDAQGLTPQEVERLVSFPLETQMSGLPAVRQVRSLSQSGLSQVVVIFEDQVDTYFARQLVFERLATAREDLPAGLEPKMGPISTGLGEIYQYTVEAGFSCPAHREAWSSRAGLCPQCGAPLVSSGMDLMGLRSIHDWIISPQLRRLAGINEVNSFGGLVRQYHVIVDPQRLLKHGLTLREVFDAIQANNQNVGAGFIVKDFEQISLVAQGLLQDANDLARVVVKAEHGTPVLLADVAEVVVGPAVRTGAAGKDGRGEVVVGMAIMLKGANSKQVVGRVKAEIPLIQKSLPLGVRINPFYDRTDLIQACIQTVAWALAQGAVLVAAVLFLLLWDLRAALTVALSLPLTAAATFLLMDRLDMTANLMSLGGLVVAIGIIVDGAIIVTENIARRLSHAAPGVQRTEVVLGALLEVARPVLFALLIMVLVFVPLFALQSLEGKMFRPLAMTVCLALVSSLVVSLTVVPVVGSWIVGHTKRRAQDNPLVRFFQGVHRPVLEWAMKGRWLTVAGAVVLMVVTIPMVKRLGTEFMPDLDEGAIAVNIVRLPTASLEGSVLQSQQIERRLMDAFPDEISTVVSKTGRAEISEDPMGPEQTDLMIMLRPRAGWKRAGLKAELIRKIQGQLAAFPGIRAVMSQPIALRVNELISGIKSDVAIKIFGDDMGVLARTAEQVAPVLASVEGAADVAIEQVSGFTQYNVRFDRRAMARHKIDVAQVNELLETAVGGKVASTLYENLRPVDIVVRLPARFREGPHALEQLLLASPLGYQVPLSQIVRIETVDAPAQVKREDSQRRIIVECNVRGTDEGSFVRRAQAALASIEQGLPAGYRIVWSGQFENQQRATRRLMILVPIVLALIFAMLWVALRSIPSALLIMANLPFAVVGGIWAMVLLGINLSVAASIGFIAVLGIAVENGLVLVGFCDELRRQGLAVTEAVTQACRLRVRPLVMTTLTTLLGLLPMLYATGAGSEIQRPLVAVIFGGLISSLVLVLVVLPVLYVLAHPQVGPAKG